MRILSHLITGSVIAAVAGTVAFAASHEVKKDPAVVARQSHMELYQFNANVLFSFAKGDVAFDAGASQAAADNIAALSKLSQMAYWPQGTSNDTLDYTRALPAIWADGSEVGAKAKGLVEAADAMAAAAGTLEGVQANLKALGGACTACHKDYRASDN